MYLSAMSVCCMCVCAHLLADRSLFVEVMPLEKLDLSLCVGERERGREGGDMTGLSVHCSRRPLARRPKEENTDGCEWGCGRLILTTGIPLCAYWRSYLLIFYSCLNFIVKYFLCPPCLVAGSQG